MSQHVCRWGIFGAAFIARKNWQAIRNASNCTLLAVASRDQQRCKQFIGDCHAHSAFASPPAALGSYEELLDRSDVEQKVL